MTAILEARSSYTQTDLANTTTYYGPSCLRIGSKLLLPVEQLRLRLYRILIIHYQQSLPLKREVIRYNNYCSTNFVEFIQQC